MYSLSGSDNRIRLFTAFPAASEREPGRNESNLLGRVARLTMIFSSVKASVYTIVGCPGSFVVIPERCNRGCDNNENLKESTGRRHGENSYHFANWDTDLFPVVFHHNDKETLNLADFTNLNRPCSHWAHFSQVAFLWWPRCGSVPGRVAEISADLVPPRSWSTSPEYDRCQLGS